MSKKDDYVKEVENRCEHLESQLNDMTDQLITERTTHDKLVNQLYYDSVKLRKAADELKDFIKQYPWEAIMVVDTDHNVETAIQKLKEIWKSIDSLGTKHAHKSMDTIKKRKLTE
jgi:ElaB/YqjD/DUF883 family membrane-anchored ribosome-binding protein